MILPDIHLTQDGYAKPYQLVKKFIPYFKPHITILLGDFIECEALSHWLESKKKLCENKRFNKECAVANNELSFLQKHSKKIVYLEGNHENWVEQYIECKPEVEGLLEIPKRLYLKERDIKWVPQNKLYHVGKMYFIHGVYIYKYHAHKHLTAYGCNICYGHCFDDQTELLTQRGFLRYQDITTQDICLTMNKQTGLLEWNAVKEKLTYDYNGSMYQFTASGIDLKIDGRHGLVYKTSKAGVFKYASAEDVANKKGNALFKVSGILPQEKEYDISDDMLCLLSWVLSEGSIYYIGTTPYIDIVQSKPEEIERIKYLLDCLSMTYHLGKKKKSPISKLQPYRFRIHVIGAKCVCEYIKDKTVPSWFWQLSNRQFELFTQEYIRGDGTVYKNKLTRMLYTNDPMWVDAFQTRLFMCGYKTMVYWRKGSLSSNKLCAQINIIHKEYCEIKPKTQCKPEPYKGKMWCVSVDNETLVVRRNHKITVTQNTHTAQTHQLNMKMQDPIMAYGLGCLCDHEPYFMRGRPANWVNQFAIMFVEEKTGRFNLNPINITRGQFIINGRIYR